MDEPRMVTLQYSHHMEYNTAIFVVNSLGMSSDHLMNILKILRWLISKLHEYTTPVMKYVSA